ncbi:MAG: galactokinase, partial [Bacteroidota bacterium]
MIQLIKQKFVALYGTQPTMVVRAPGRINLIGEHTDYNNGFVLPAAINKAIYIAISKRDDAEIHLYSMDFNASFETNINELLPIKSWPTYILGVADQFNKKGYAIGGFNLVMYGDVPIGAGLSSSAAVECSVAYALNELFLLSIEKIDLVKMAQKAEHEFAGVNCGIMDQFASMFGQANQVVRLDCRSLDYEYFPFSMQEVSIVLLDTCVKHSLASSEYNTRRLQCEAGVAAIQTKYPAVKSLR